MEPKKENKTIGIIATVGTALICGCAALISCVFGGLGVAGVPVTTTVNGVDSQAPMPIALGIGLLCLSVILIAVPIIVGVLTLRKKKGSVEAEVVSNEPLPPAS